MKFNQRKRIKVADEKIQFNCGEARKILSQEKRDEYNDNATEMTYITSNSLCKKSIKKIFNNGKMNFGTPAADDFAKKKTIETILLGLKSIMTVMKNGEINAMPFPGNDENSIRNFDNIDNIFNEQSITQLKRAPSSNFSCRVK
ncbi:hypothetical protein Glove_86g119 [Diversispora epigaea]|uniref:Uncharacterized protein n=1 Tax=Diversispora epigaea TaxID=1348612 RepID=A0A397JA57_9GLOM|nr:hypothetical protein Glove_86g119 [Diversispora epigaea]